MNYFLAFRKFITPLFIQVIFWIGVVASVITALSVMFRGGFAIIAGLIFLVIGPFIVRIECELLILLFRIYEELVAIRTGVPPTPTAVGFPVTFGRPAAPPPPPTVPPTGGPGAPAG